MRIWKKLGACGDLQAPAQKAFGRVAKEFGKIGEDIFITSIRDGNHGSGSFHYIGMAFDIRYPKATTKAFEVRIRQAAGPNCDVIFHNTHIHVEYDPKG